MNKYSLYILSDEKVKFHREHPSWVSYTYALRTSLLSGMLTRLDSRIISKSACM